jgi:hypothetical protein
MGDLIAYWSDLSHGRIQSLFRVLRLAQATASVLPDIRGK